MPAFPVTVHSIPIVCDGLVLRIKGDITVGTLDQLCITTTACCIVMMLPLHQLRIAYVFGKMKSTNTHCICYDFVCVIDINGICFGDD